MCGILGNQWTRPDRRTQLFISAIGVLMEDRGRHSAGIWTPTWGVRKWTGAFSDGMNAHALRGTASCIGHCRFATVGDPTVANAHPFVYKHITGIHNGGVANWRELNKQYDRKFEVDSQHIFANIADNEPLTELNAWGAVAYIDSNAPGRIYLFRSGSTSLHVKQVYLKSGDLLGAAFASEDDALEASLKIAGFRDSKWITIEEHVLHYIEGGKVFKTDTKVPFGRQGFSGTKGAFGTTIGKLIHNHGTNKGSKTDRFGVMEKSSGASTKGDLSGHNLSMLDNMTRGRCATCYTLTEVFEFHDTGVKLCLEHFVEWNRQDRENAMAKLEGAKSPIPLGPPSPLASDHDPDVYHAANFLRGGD